MAIGQFGGPCIERHRVSIYDRGGTSRAYNLVDVSKVEWERQRDAKSAAAITLLGRACSGQADIIRAIADGAARLEVVVHRGNDRVWEGPVLTVETVGQEYATIVATDIMEYLDYTSLSKPWPTDPEVQTLMGDRLEEIITYELTEPYDMTTNAGVVHVPRWEGIDPPINVLAHMLVYPGSVLTRSNTLDYEMKLGEHINNLVDGGMDYTVVGRRLIIWDSAMDIGRTRRVTDADFLGPIKVTRYGSDHWSISHLSATQGTSEEGEEAPRFVGHAGGPHDYYGVWENIVSQQSETSTDTPTQTELNTQAGRDIVHRTPAPLEVTLPDGVGIRLTDTLTINDLVPGVVMPLVTDLNIQRVSQPQRLDRVKVTEDANGEVVSVSLSPVGDVEALRSHL